MAKPWYLSRTLWLNFLAIAAMFVQSATGFAISPEEQAAILAVVNIFLRFLTKEEIA